MPTTTAQDLLNQLIEEIAHADPDMLPPPSKSEPGDKPLGKVEDETIRKVFSLSHFYRREGRRMQVDLESAGTDPYDDLTFSLYKQKHEALQELFWYLLRTHMNLYEYNGIGIRQNWEVVQGKEKAKDMSIEITKLPFPPNLRKLLGLDD